MTTLTKTWRQPAPTRAGLAELRPPDSQQWTSRLLLDGERAAANQSAELMAITRAIEDRSHELGADALVLTGSTARNRRTQVSDLDYHVIGGRPGVEDLPSDIDLYNDEPDEFRAKMLRGDDFVHWTLRYGCVLFDNGVLHEAVVTAIERDLWPDAERKRQQARRAIDFSQKLAATGDYAALLEVSRGALSLTARWWLLAHEIFPLARDELAEQLIASDQAGIAEGLESSIHRRPTTEEITSRLAQADELTVRPCLQ